MSSARAPQYVSQVVCDGINLYGLATDETLWKAKLEFPITWIQLAPLPNNEIIDHIGVTFGAVLDLPDDILFAVTQKPEILYFWDGITWTQRWPLP